MKKQICVKCGNKNEDPKFKMCSKCRITHKVHTHNYRENLKVRILNQYGGSNPKCSCGEKRPDALTIHPLHGAAPLVGYGATALADLLKRGLPEGYFVICYNCKKLRDKVKI